MYFLLYTLKYKYKQRSTISFFTSQTAGILQIDTKIDFFFVENFVFSTDIFTLMDT